MATVSIGLPGRAPAAIASAISPAAEGRVSGGGGPAAVSTAVMERAEIGKASRRGSLTPLVIFGHGLLAFSTIALVLLATLGTAAS
jgi:hypothetical protein